MSALLVLQGSGLSPWAQSNTQAVLAAVLASLGSTAGQYSVNVTDAVVVQAVATSLRRLAASDSSSRTESSATPAAIPTVFASSMEQSAAVQVIISAATAGLDAIQGVVADAASSGLLASNLRMQGGCTHGGAGMPLRHACPQSVAHSFFIVLDLASAEKRAPGVSGQPANFLPGCGPAQWLCDPGSDALALPKPKPCGGIQQVSQPCHGDWPGDGSSRQDLDGHRRHCGCSCRRGCDRHRHRWGGSVVRARWRALGALLAAPAEMPPCNPWLQLGWCCG